MIKETAGGMPCKGHQEDGDSMLWAALLKASGAKIPGINIDESIVDSQIDGGQTFRSPLRAQNARSGVKELNSFSRDMATGFTLAAASDSAPYRVLDAYENWVEFVLNNRCRACKDTDGRCVMTPATFWMASYAGAENVPAAYALTRFLNTPYLLIASATNPKGFTLHLVGVSLFVMVYHYGSRKKLPASLSLATKILYQRQPQNAFFAWLAGKNEDAKAINDAVKAYVAMNGQGNRHQWAWERDDEEEAWKNSCGWDVEFIDNLLELQL
jgi:hypothetical protein